MAEGCARQQSGRGSEGSRKYTTTLLAALVHHAVARTVRERFNSRTRFGCSLLHVKQPAGVVYWYTTAMYGQFISENEWSRLT